MDNFCFSFFSYRSSLINKLPWKVAFAALLTVAPITKSTASNIIEIAVGEGFVCGLFDFGGVDCSGPATLIERITPPTDLPKLVHISAGNTDVCGIDEAGDAHCWGTNFRGKFEAPDDFIGYESISIGTAHWCGLTTIRAIHCVGSNNFGEATPPEPFTAYNQVFARWQSTCGKRADNSVHCWGDGGPNRQEMAAFNGPLVYMMPQQRTSCGIDGADQVVCDGAPLPGLSGAFRRMSASYWGICALEYNGEIQCVADPVHESKAWLSSLENILKLEDVPAGGNYEQIDGRYTGLTCAKSYAGDVACWGREAEGLRIPGQDILLQKPEGLRAEIYSGNTIELFWQAENLPRYTTPKIRAYEVWRDDILVATINGASYFDDTLTPGVNYTYEIKALGFDIASYSEFSDVLTVNTLPDTGSGAGGGISDAPTVEGGVINLNGGGWYQVQNATTYQTICQGVIGCAVSDGTYIVINHTTGERWENVEVNNVAGSGGGGLPVLPVSTVTVDGTTISWPNDGWYQVQDNSDYQAVCEGGLQCSVSPGRYDVINHTTGMRWNDVVVDGGSGSARANDPRVTGNTISWPDNGWYQVQAVSNYESICEGGTSCMVEDGVYNVINLTVGDRWVVTVDSSI